jgi:hypothetical protein
MSKASGAVLVATGLAVGAFALYYGHETGEPTSADQQSEIAKIVSQATVQSQTPERAGELAVTPSARRGAAEPVYGRPQQGQAPAIAALVQPQLTSPRPSDEGARVALVRELQRELKRVGCYHGEISGIWTSSSRRAMKTFTDRMNAALPVDEPDYILLSLLQGTQERTCGSCPPGEVLTSDNRCLPGAVAAHSDKRARSSVAALNQTAGSARLAETTGPAITGWSTTTVAASTLPAAPSSAATSTAAEPPLDGRMAIGAPAPDKAPGADRLGRLAAAAPDPSGASGLHVADQPTLEKRSSAPPRAPRYERRQRYAAPASRYRSGGRSSYAQRLFARLSALAY